MAGLTLCEVRRLEQFFQARSRKLGTSLGVVRVKGFYKVRLLVWWCIGCVMICPYQACHIKNPQPLREWISGGVERALETGVSRVDINMRVRVNTANTYDLTSSYCIACVAMSWVLRRVIDFEPVERR